MKTHPLALCLRPTSYILLAFFQTLAFGQKTQDEPYAFDLRYHANYTPADQGVSEVRIDLGEIPAQGTGRVVIVARNTSQKSVNLGDTFSGCKCLKVTLSKPQMEPGEECEIELIFNVQVEPVELRRLTTTLLFPTSAPEAATRIALSYRLAGMLAFNQRTASLRVEDGTESKEFNLPITISHPIREDQIEIFCNGALKKAKSAIIREGGRTYVNVTVSPKDLEAQLATGSIKIASRDKSRADEINCFIEKVPPLTITPKTLRFRWNETIRQWESEAMVQVALRNANPGRTISDKEIRVKVSAENISIETESKPIRDGLTRVYVRIPGKETINSQTRLDWEVRLGGKIFETDTDVATLISK